MRQAAVCTTRSLAQDQASMAEAAPDNDVVHSPSMSPPPQFGLRGIFLAMHLVGTLLSVPGVGLFVWQAVGPLAAIAATVIVGQCAVMLLVAMFGWLPAKDEG